MCLGVKVNSFADEEGWHGNHNDENKEDEEDLQRKKVKICVPFHSVDRTQIAKCFEPVQKHFLPMRIFIQITNFW